jgi:nitrite reductase/ring-hydroxylating ferredoxin subunit
MRCDGWMQFRQGAHECQIVKLREFRHRFQLLMASEHVIRGYRKAKNVTLADDDVSCGHGITPQGSQLTLAFLNVKDQQQVECTGHASNYRLRRGALAKLKIYAVRRKQRPTRTARIRYDLRGAWSGQFSE